ncbi:MAG: DUF1292 domain-containing protein [Clostridia bacterium]|nr:DUF1292 domain-containing protein [Clostridia bacterium]
MSKEEIDGCASDCGSCSGCGHDHAEHNMPEGMSPIITLTDDDGKDVEFEVLDVVVLEDGKEFLIVSEANGKDTDDVEVVILEIKEEAGEEVYDTVVDEKLAETVFNEFVKQQEELTYDDSEDEESDEEDKE